MEGILNHFFENRLKELGIEKHHFTWKKEVVAPSGMIIVPATNEYLYLYDVSPKGAFQIESDTEIVNDDKFYTDSAPYRLFELKGDIVIRNRSEVEQSFSFFRIIPEN